MDELPQEEKALVVRMLMDYGYTPITANTLVKKYQFTYNMWLRWHELEIMSAGYNSEYTLNEKGLKKLGETI